MTTDTIGRRTRGVRRPTGNDVFIHERELIWAEIILRHGPQSAFTLYEFTKHLPSCGNWVASRRRARQLYDEHAILGGEFEGIDLGGPFFDYPDWQDEVKNAQSNFAIYDVNDFSIRALQIAGRFHENTPLTSSSGKHDFFASHSVASLDLATRRYPEFRAQMAERGVDLPVISIRYIYHDEILTRAAEKLGILVNITDPKTGETATEKFYQDRIGAFEYTYPDRKRYLAFNMENGRGTERKNPASIKNHKSERRNILVYDEYIGNGIYKKHLKLNCGMLLLNLFSNPGRKEGVEELIEEYAELGGETGNKFTLNKMLPQFGRTFRPPEPLLHLLTDPWERVGNPPFSLINPPL